MTPVSFARKAEIKLGRQTEVFSRAFVARRGKIAETRDQVSIQGCVGLNASGGLAGSRNHRGEDGEPDSEKKGEGDKRGREWEGEVRETHESDHPRPWNVSRHRVVNPPGFSLSLPLSPPVPPSFSLSLLFSSACHFFSESSPGVPPFVGVSLRRAIVYAASLQPAAQLGRWTRSFRGFRLSVSFRSIRGGRDI